MVVQEYIDELQYYLRCDMMYHYLVIPGIWHLQHGRLSVTGDNIMSLDKCQIHFCWNCC